MNKIRRCKLEAIKRVSRGDVKCGTGNKAKNIVIPLGPDSNESYHGDHLGMHTSGKSLSWYTVYVKCLSKSNL